MTGFEDRFEELWTLAYRVAFRILGDREAAEDVAQETLARVARQWRRAEGYAPALTARVAAGRAIDVWRRRRHLPPGAWSPASPRGAGVERRDELVAALRALPERQRRTVVLRYLADLSEADTARALGCSVGTVKTQTSRALASLRHALADPDSGG